MKSSHRVVLALCLAALLASCGGGGGGDDGGGAPPPPGLSGTWFGTLEDASLVLSTASLTISGGTITQVLVDGFNTGLTGTVIQQSPQVMRYTLTDGVDTLRGIFLLHADMHLAFADDGLNFGVLQKNASSLPTYVYNADLNGAWTGMVLLTDFGSVFTEAAATATCAFGTTVTCSLTDPSGTFAATFPSADTFFGRWNGTFTGPTTGNTNVFLSADKSFAGAWACVNPDQFWPEDCVFYALHR